MEDTAGLGAANCYVGGDVSHVEVGGVWIRLIRQLPDVPSLIFARSVVACCIFAPSTARIIVSTYEPYSSGGRCGYDFISSSSASIALTLTCLLDFFGIGCKHEVFRFIEGSRVRTSSSGSSNNPGFGALPRVIFRVNEDGAELLWTTGAPEPSSGVSAGRGLRE